MPTGCVPADCSDGNACTTDVCQGGTCVHRREGFDAVACELAKLLEPNLCGTDPIDAKLAKAIVVKATRARTFVGKAENNTKTGQKLLARALRQLTELRNRVSKAGERGRLTSSCRTKLDNLLSERQALVQGLTTP